MPNFPALTVLYILIAYFSFAGGFLFFRALCSDDDDGRVSCYLLALCHLGCLVFFSYVLDLVWGGFL